MDAQRATSEQAYWGRNPVAGRCYHCGKALTDANTADTKSMELGPDAQWCNTCAYVTHPDGEGEWKCDGSCAAKEDKWTVESGWATADEV